MRIVSLQLTNFRNIEDARLEFDDRLTVIAGPNGQGKTNLLEAVYLLTGGKSFRGARDMDLVRWKCPQGFVAALCDSSARTNEIELEIEGPEGQRRGRFARVNGVEYGRATNIAGVVTAVVFEPGHLSLVKGGPEGRRRFLDAALCQLYPGYIAILRRYTRALTQKNTLLKQYGQTPDAAGMLDAFDTELAAAGEEITRRRTEYLAAAGPVTEGYYRELSGGEEELVIQYVASDSEKKLSELFCKSRNADIRAGFATAGPHREDFDVILKGQSARTFGSQGQQRSAVLSLKLAEAEMARRVTGEHPVLLLDDVLSELDDGRQAYLLKRMDGKQCLVTTCDTSAFEKNAGKTVFLKNGQIIEI